VLNRNKGPQGPQAFIHQILGALLFILLQSLPMSALAMDMSEAPLIQAAEASREQYLGFLQANSRIPLSEWLDQEATRAETAEVEHLSRLLERAQSAWLNEPQTTSKSLLKQITARALDHDWRDSEREAIHYAYFRLAQLATHDAERDENLKLAIAFDFEFSPDATLFPPPLIARFQKLKAELLAAAHLVKLSRIFPNHQIVRINGRKFTTLDLDVPILEGRFRISAFSDEYPAFHATLTRSQLSELVLRQAPVAPGRCNNELTSPGESKPPLNKVNLAGLDGLGLAEVFYNPSCIQPVGENVALHSPTSDPLVSLMQPFRQPQDAMPAGWPTAPENNSTSVSRKTWLWVGATALATSVAYFVYRDQERRSRENSPAPPEPNVRNLN
jgi:hypothetical protein